MKAGYLVVASKGSQAQLGQFWFGYVSDPDGNSFVRQDVSAFVFPDASDAVRAAANLNMDRVSVLHRRADGRFSSVAA